MGSRWREEGSLGGKVQLDQPVFGADDGIRTRDPHLGNFVAVVSCVAVNLSSASELRVLVSSVSSVSGDRWSGRDFVGDSLA